MNRTYPLLSRPLRALNRQLSDAMLQLAGWGIIRERGVMSVVESSTDILNVPDAQGRFGPFGGRRKR